MSPRIFIIASIKRLLQAISVELSIARRSAKDRQNDGVLRETILRLSGRQQHLRKLRHMLRAILRHNHVKHQSSQPQRQREAHNRTVHQHEQRHKHGTRPAQRTAGGKFVSSYNQQKSSISVFQGLYDSIKAEPFKIPEDDGNDLMHTFFNPDKEGWLWKQGGRYKSWKRRWFILNDNCLYYFEYTTDKEPRGIIPLENISVRECTDRQKQHCFELYASGGADFIKACKTDSEGKVVEGKHTVYRMSASSEDEKVCDLFFT